MTALRTARIFISYARADGADFAAQLRTELSAEFGADAIWQDIERIEGGRNWWHQITEALDAVSFMVLVATPRALASPVVAKEWRYARSKGVCVFPVLVPGLTVDFNALPQWMRDQHFYNLEKQRDTFINHLKNPCEQPKVPFLAPDLMPHYVQRPALYDALKSQLLKDDRQTPVALTTALQGGGGFGKTTLATALCHDEDIQTAFDDGVLWVTLGEQPNVLQELKRLCDALSRTPVSILDIDDGAQKLADLLADRDCLLVVDDVWNAQHVKPFLRGGKRTARLITTRRVDITVESRAAATTVDEMETDEAARLLSSDIDGLSQTELNRLAARLGEWALMLELANGILRKRIHLGATAPQAFDYLTKLLDKRGIVGIKRDGDSDARRRDAAGVLGVSLDQLTEAERLDLYQLSVFRDDADVPLSSMMALWGVDELDADDAVQKYAGLSLIKYNTSTGALRLHDVVREFLAAQIADQSALHRRLVDGWGDLHALPDTYAWRNLAYHLIEGRQADWLYALLTDYRWLQAKLDATDANGLTADCAAYLEAVRDGDNVQTVRLIRSALTMSGHVLNEDKSQWGTQLVGRLMTWRRRNPTIHSLTEIIMTEVRGVYPTFPDSDYAVLEQAGGALIRTLIGHTDHVNHVVLTPNGQWAVSASHDNTVRVWDLETGGLLQTLTDHTDTVSHIALTPDGRRAVSVSRDRTVRVWDLETGKLLYTLTGHISEAKHFTLTRYGQWVVSTSWNNILRVWNLETGQMLYTLIGHTGEVKDIALTADGRRAVSASSDNTVRVWNLETGAPLYTLNDHTSEVWHVELTADGRRAVSASLDKTMRVWDLEAGMLLAILKGSYFPLALTPDGRRVVSASSDKTLQVWNIETGVLLHILTGHVGTVRHIKLTADGRRAVSISDDRTLRVWDIETGVLLHTLTDPTLDTNHLALTADGRRAVSISWGKLRVWNIETAALPHTLTGHTNTVNHIALTPDRRRGVSVSSDNTLRVWNLETGILLYTLTGHTNTVSHVALTPDGRRAVSASSDNTLRVWNLETGILLYTLTGHTNNVWHVALTPDGRQAVSVSGKAYGGGDDNTLRVWSIDTGALLQTLYAHNSAVIYVALTPDGQQALSASAEGTMWLWDIETWTLLAILNGHNSAVIHVALSPDGRRVVSASLDETMRVWDLDKGAALGVFDTTEVGRAALVQAFPEFNDFWGFQRRDGHILTWDREYLSAAGIAFHADAGLPNAAWVIPGQTFVAGDEYGRVLFLRVRGGGEA